MPSDKEPTYLKYRFLLMQMLVMMGVILLIPHMELWRYLLLGVAIGIYGLLEIKDMKARGKL